MINVRIHTSLPSGKQRQKKSGRGRPTPFLMASVITAVISMANKSPASFQQALTQLVKLLLLDNPFRTKENYLECCGADHKRPSSEDRQKQR